jgi:hypothetical protein
MGLFVTLLNIIGNISRFGEFNCRFGEFNCRFGVLREFARKGLIYSPVFAAKPQFCGRNRQNSRFNANVREFAEASDAGGPDRLVVAERDRRARPVGRGLRQVHGGAEVAQPADWCVARDRPAVDIGWRDLVRDVLERSVGYLAAADQPMPGLRQ